MSRHYTIAPDQIRTQGFGRKVRGYDPRQVRSFLFEVAEQIDQLSRELNNAKQRLAAAEDSSISADTSGRQAVADQADRTDPGVAVRSAATAEAEANDIVSRAHVAAETLNAEAEQRLSDLKHQIDELSTLRERMVSQIETLLNSQLEHLRHIQTEMFPADDAQEAGPVLADTPSPDTQV